MHQNKKPIDDVPNAFWRKYVKPESQATAKHKWHKRTFDAITKTLYDFVEELNDCAGRASGDNAHNMIDSLLHAKQPPHLERSVTLAYLKNGTYDQIVAFLERELQLSGLENDGEVTLPTMTAVPTNDKQQNSEQTKIARLFCKKLGHVIRDCRKRMKKEQEQEMILRPKTRNLRHLDHLHPVPIANGQIILHKDVGAVPMPLIDPNGSNEIIKQTIELMGKNNETWPIQDFYQFSKTI